jgi:hypothetical protein
MDRMPCFSKKLLAHHCVVLILLTASLSGSVGAQTPHKKTAAQSDAESGVTKNVQQELVRIETGFFEAWKTQDQSYFREHMPESGVFWGESGTLSRDQQLAEQLDTAKLCTVEGYGLSEFGVLPLSSGTYLLTYKAEQYVNCGGSKMPVHMNGSSVYILKSGHWQAVYRAEVPLKNQS